MKMNLIAKTKNKFLKCGTVITLSLIVALGSVLTANAASAGVTAEITNSSILGQFKYYKVADTLKITLKFKEKHKTTNQVYSGSCSEYAHGSSSVSDYRSADAGYKYLSVHALGYVGGTLVDEATAKN